MLFVYLSIMSIYIYHMTLLVFNLIYTYSIFPYSTHVYYKKREMM